MIVRFHSTEAGELIMMSDLARILLKAMDKACNARGVIQLAEIPDALGRLEALLAEPPPPPEAPDSGVAPAAAAEGFPPKLAARVWPFVEMLKRTQRGGAQAHILWEASADFG